MSVDLIARGLAAKALAAAGSGGGGSSYPEVATWAALPAATGSGDIYVVQTTTGIPLVNRKPAGLWRDSGAWDYLGNGISASDLINVPAGGLAATDVQSALNELDGDLGSHIGLGGAVHVVATGGAAGFMAAADKTKLDGVASGATANLADATLLDRANHTGTQSIATILAAATARIFGRTTAGAGAGEELTAAQVRAMINVADGSTANSADATLLARANHTGTQAVTTLLASAPSRLFGRNSAGSGPGEELSPATVKAMLDIASTDISDWTEAVQDVVGPLIAAAGGSYNDAGNSITLPGGGGGSPGGLAGELQYNNGGAFAGAANVEIDTDNLKLVSTTDPAAPTGGIVLYSKSIAGRHLPKIIGPSGIDTVLQVGLHGNSVFMVAPASGTTAPTVWGGTLTTAATMSLQQTIASANPWLATFRKRFASTATAGNATGMRTAYAPWFRGNAAGFGGFFFRTQFGQNINLNGAQQFHGLCASTGVLASTAGAVAALLNMIGVGYDTTDSSAGNWQLFRNDGAGTATKVDLGANAARNTTHGYDLIIYCPPGAATDIFVRIVNLHTNVVVLDTSYNTDIPAVNVGLAYKGEGNNGAVASAMNLEIAKVYIERGY